MGVDSDISPRQARLFTRPLHYTDYTYLEQIDKEPPPFQSTGHGRYQRWSRWNCDFISAINYLVSDDKIYEGTCERLWKSQLAVGFDRDVSFGEIFGCLRICITSISCPQPQLVSWSVGRVEWALEFLRYRVLKLRANETYEMGEKHTNRTRPVRKIILRMMQGLMFNRTKVARVVQSPKRAFIVGQQRNDYV